jgi:hypothetical protein
MNREPAAIVASITGAAVAIIALVVSFGLDISNDQQSAILGVVAVVAPLVAGLVIRGKVFAPATVARVAGRHVADGPVDA